MSAWGMTMAITWAPFWSVQVQRPTVLVPPSVTWVTV
jgi:hypothetical protein